MFNVAELIIKDHILSEAQRNDRIALPLAWPNWHL